MRVVFLANASTIHTVKRVNKLSRLGCTVHLITLHPSTGDDVVDHDVTVHLLPFHPPLGYVLNVWKLRGLLQCIRPDVLHAHYASGYGTLSRLAGFHPTVLSVWGTDVFDFPYQARWKKRLLCKNLLFADYIDSSSFVMKRQTESLARLKHAITILPPGVDCDRFRPLPHRGDGAEIVIGTVRTLEEKYGVEYLISAFAILTAVSVGMRLKLLIVGEGPLRGKLEKLARDLGIHDITEFTGKVSHRMIPKYLNRLSVFVAVSVLDSESFGVAVLEASACGIPVVVSDVGGLPEVVENNVSGFVVPKRDPEATAKAIMRLIGDPELRERMGRAGRRFVLGRYEWNENAGRIKKLYEDVIEK